MFRERERHIKEERQRERKRERKKCTQKLGAFWYDPNKSHPFVFRLKSFVSITTVKKTSSDRILKRYHLVQSLHFGIEIITENIREKIQVN